jgi:hypothetical protein
VTFTARTDETTKQQFGVADVTLAPLAEANTSSNRRDEGRQTELSPTV